MNNMNGDTRAFSNQSPASSSKTTGATRRLDPHVLERPAVPDPRVHHAIERDASGQTKIFVLGLTVKPGRKFEHGVFESNLQRMRDIEVPFLHRPAAFSPRPKARLQL